MTKLRDWFYLNRRHKSIRKMSQDIGINYPYALRVVNGNTRCSVKLAKKLQEYTQNEIVWHKIIEDACEVIASKAQPQKD